MMKYVKGAMIAVGVAICLPLYASSTVQLFDTEYLEKKQKQFEEIDVANNGYISYDQAAELMPAIADQISKVDLNKDEKITWHEVEYVYRSFSDSLGSPAAQQLDMIEQDKQMLDQGVIQ